MKPNKFPTPTEQSPELLPNGLPKFQDIIKIEVEVQSIYEKMLEQLPNDYKHREMVAHAIIGSTVNTGGLGYIYNALNGYTSAIDFKYGDIVICAEEGRKERYDSNIENEEGKSAVSFTPTEGYKPDWKLRDVSIGECRIISIDLYRSDKLMVEFQSYSTWGTPKLETKTAWVNHKQCTKIPVEKAIVDEEKG